MAGRSAIGLDIGTSGVRAAEVTFGKGKLTLDKFGQVALPDGAVTDGEVADIDAVATCVRQLWSHTKFSGKKVIVGVANSKVLVRQVDLPWLPEGEFRSALHFQVQDYIPMPVEDAVLDFLTLEEFQSDAGARMVRGLLVAAPREMVMSLVTAVQKAGLTPVGVDLTSFAVLRALAQPGALGDTEVEAVVDVGARVTNVVIHAHGAPRFVRILPLGGKDITAAIAGRIGVEPAEAESLKQQVALGLAEPDPAVDEAMASAVTSLVEEIRGSLDYYTASSGTAALSRVTLSGGGARMPGLADRLAEAVRLPVVTANPLQSLTIGKTGLSPEQLLHVQPLAAVPVGLALGGAA